MQILLRMIQKYIFQIALVLIIISISILFYFNFLYQKKTTNSQSTLLLEENQSEIQEDVSSNLVNIEYNSYDEDGNSFYLNAESATIKMQETDLNEQNKVKFVNVVEIFCKRLSISCEQSSQVHGEKDSLPLITIKASNNSSDPSNLLKKAPKVQFLILN